jgi:hypothetical protein
MSKEKVREIDAAIGVLRQEKNKVIKAEEDRVKAEKAETSRKSRAEIDALVESYNQNEREQTQRLRRLFYLIKNRSGFRRVDFNNGEMWSNCWDQDKQERDIFRRLDHSVTEIAPGE